MEVRHSFEVADGLHIGNTSFQTFDRIHVSHGLAINTINSSRVGKSGWSTKYSITIMNGGAMPLTATT